MQSQHAVQGARKIDFRSFRKAIEEIAKAKSVDPITIEQQIIASGGPQMSSTTPSCHIRLHDDKASYTGMFLTPQTVQTSTHRAGLVEILCDRLVALLVGAATASCSLSWPMNSMRYRCLMVGEAFFALVHYLDCLFEFQIWEAWQRESREVQVHCSKESLTCRCVQGWRPIGH